ncbi:hypothetical protein AAC387_Pa12g0665 [Persea americana]
MESEDGMFPFHLLLPVRVRVDGSSSHLLPLTERMNEKCPHIGTGDDPIEVRNSQHRLHRLIPLSYLLLFSLSPELTQASERLRLTAARGSDPSLSPSLFRFLSPMEAPGVRSSLI